MMRCVMGTLGTLRLFVSAVALYWLGPRGLSTLAIRPRTRLPLGRRIAHRIGVVFPFPHLDAVQSLCNVVESLAASGYDVDIFTGAGPDYMVPVFDHKGIEIIDSGPRRARPLRHVSDKVSQALLVVKRHRQRGYRCFIGVDAWGLAQAARFARLVQVHPTLPEALKEAALDVSGMAIHLPKPLRKV